MLSEVFARNDITNKKAMTTTVPLHQTIVKYTKSDWMRFVVYAQLTYFRKCNELKCSTNSRRNRNRNRITDQIDQCDCMLKRSLHKRDTLNVASAIFFAFFIWDGFFFAFGLSVVSFCRRCCCCKIFSRLNRQLSSMPVYAQLLFSQSANFFSVLL